MNNNAKEPMEGEHKSDTEATESKEGEEKLVRNEPKEEEVEDVDKVAKNDEPPAKKQAVESSSVPSNPVDQPSNDDNDDYDYDYDYENEFQDPQSTTKDPYAYMNFANEKREEFMQRHPNITVNGMYLLMTSSWSKLSEAEKNVSCFVLISLLFIYVLINKQLEV